MPKLIAPALTLGVLSLLAIVSCSSGSNDPNSSRGGSVPATSVPAATSGSGAQGGSTSQTGVDNGSGTITRAPAAGATGAMMPTQQMTPNTSISRDPIALDDCG